MLDEDNSGIDVTATFSDGNTKSISDWTIEKPAELKADKTSKVTIEYKGKSCTLEVKCTTISEKAFKKSCKEYSYEKLARNPDDYMGKNITLTGEVIQVMEDSSGVVLRVNVTQGNYGIWDDTVMVVHEPEEDASRILENDIVTMYGISSELYTYTSVMGAEITIPSMLAEYIDVN